MATVCGEKFGFFLVHMGTIFPDPVSRTATFPATTELEKTLYQYITVMIGVALAGCLNLKLWFLTQ